MLGPYPMAHHRFALADTTRFSIKFQPLRSAIFLLKHVQRLFRSPNGICGNTIGATRPPKFPFPAPTFPGEFRGGESALRTSGTRGLVSKNRENNWLRQKNRHHTKPKPGHFSIGLLLYFVFPTSTGFNFFFLFQ